MTDKTETTSTDSVTLAIGIAVFILAFYVLDFVVPDRCHDGTLIDLDIPKACRERGGVDTFPGWLVLLSSAAIGGAVAGVIRLWRLADRIIVFKASGSPRSEP